MRFRTQDESCISGWEMPIWPKRSGKNSYYSDFMVKYYNLTAELLFIANTAESDRFTPVEAGSGFQQHLGAVIGLWSSLDVPPA